MSLLLHDFLHGYPGYEGEREYAMPYRPVSIDSRTIKPGSLFIALRGETYDGHDYAAAALTSGASLVVLDHLPVGMKTADSARVLVVTDTLDFLQQLAAWHRRSYTGTLIGITGSNGKTTTREMVAEVLAQRYRVFRSSGNKNNHIGLPLMLLEMDMQSEYAVLELGSNHPGEIAQLSQLSMPDAALVTNIGKGHVGFFSGLEGIYLEKTALFDTVELGVIFLNMEDDYLRRYEGSMQLKIRVGQTPDCDVWGMAAGYDEQGCFTLLLLGETAVKLPVPGEHQIGNALMAAAVGLHYGLDIEEVRQGLQRFVPVGQRMESVDLKGIRLINDAYNANPDSLRAAIDYLGITGTPASRRVLVLGDMLELGEYEEEEHLAAGYLAVQQELDLVLLYGPASKIIQRSLSGKTGKTAIGWYDTHLAIASHLQNFLQPGDVVLVKGSRSMRMEKVIKHLQVLMAN